MAAAVDPHDVLCSTDGKENFIRLTRLLISGGTTLLRETFDMIISPSTLPTTLNNSSTKAQLKTAKLTKPQWDCLYPCPGLYGRSTDLMSPCYFVCSGQYATSPLQPQDGMRYQPLQTTV